MIVERKFVLDVKTGAETNIDIDCSPDTDSEELSIVINELKKMDFKKFKFKIVNLKYTEEIAEYIAKFVQTFAIVDSVKMASDKELFVAFIVKFNKKEKDKESK